MFEQLGQLGRFLFFNILIKAFDKSIIHMPGKISKNCLNRFVFSQKGLQKNNKILFYFSDI